MRKKILVVDDEPDIVAVMKYTLERNDFEVITAYNGEEGIEKARSSSPDLIVLDVLMPKLSGDIAGTMLRKDPLTCNIPIIFLTNVPLEFLTSNEPCGEAQMHIDNNGNVLLPKLSSEEVFMEVVRKSLDRSLG